MNYLHTINTSLERRINDDDVSLKTLLKIYATNIDAIAKLNIIIIKIYYLFKILFMVSSLSKHDSRIISNKENNGYQYE
jgi:hypothetical protein